jgi:hypothetical protein
MAIQTTKWGWLVVRNSKEEIPKKQDAITSGKEKGGLTTLVWFKWKLRICFLKGAGSWSKTAPRLDFGRTSGLVINRWWRASHPYITSLGKSVTVAQVLSTVRLNISFRRAGVGENRFKWLELVGCLLDKRLTRRKDTFVWNGCKTFSMRSMYNDIMTKEGVPFDISSWKVKVH